MPEINTSARQRVANKIAAFVITFRSVQFDGCRRSLKFVCRRRELSFIRLVAIVAVQSAGDVIVVQRQLDTLLHRDVLPVASISLVRKHLLFRVVSMIIR